VNLFRSRILGSLIGALPGAGADIAAWVSYVTAKRYSQTPELFGKGHDEGLIEAGAANNASLSGAWIPTLVFGIPGDSITAIVIGVLYLKGLEPGPVIFIKTPELVYAIFIAFLIANLLLIPLGWCVIRISRNFLRLPQNFFIPIVLSCCMVGSFAINNTIYGVGIMLIFGIIGWFFEQNNIPVAPAILGIVLGGMPEFNFVTSMLKSLGNLLGLVDRPIASTLALLVGLVCFWPLLKRVVR
jgi:TctA family transporter